MSKALNLILAPYPLLEVAPTDFHALVQLVETRKARSDGVNLVERDTDLEEGFGHKLLQTAPVGRAGRVAFAVGLPTANVGRGLTRRVPHSPRFGLTFGLIRQ
jgi:hypothetical protein